MAWVKFQFLAAAVLMLAGCGPSAEDEKTVEPAEDPAPVIVPASHVGVWSADGCDNPAVSLEAGEIRHFYMSAPAALTSVQASRDGRLEVGWSDEGVATTDIFQLTDGRLDHVSTVTPTETDTWISEPMMRCPDGTPMS
ncbi:MAG: hypothetical protein K2X07_01930 [Caulobacteraceae bacterium]|nr:hypothetical protein [Caulobacteraceae bacterium]